jgi:hypothetical protein
MPAPYRSPPLIFAFSSSLPTAFPSQSKKAKASAEGDDVKVEKVEISYGPKGVKSGEQVFGIAHIYASFNDTFVVRTMNAQHSLGRAHRAVQLGQFHGFPDLLFIRRCEFCFRRPSYSFPFIIVRPCLPSLLVCFFST